MASARRPRTSFRPATKNTEGDAHRNEDGGAKSKQRKRRLTDMLGPPWSKEDLELFYQAFRRHGKDWKKAPSEDHTAVGPQDLHNTLLQSLSRQVSGSMQKRTAEMVEALYNTNKAYLSLPEGAASAAGLIAMMTDHYNLLDGSQSPDEQTSDDVGGSDDLSNQTQRPKLKKALASKRIESSSIRPNGLVGPTSFGGPSPTKKPRTNRFRTVGKRTPRFPIGSALEKRAKTNQVSVSKLHDEVEEDYNSDVAAARALVSKPTASSNTPSRRSLRQATALHNGEKESLLRTDSEASVKPSASTSQTDIRQEGSPQSKERQYDGATKASSSTLGDGGSGRDGNTPAFGDTKSRLKKPFSKKMKLQSLDDEHEAAKILDKRKDDAKDLMEVADRQGSEADEPAEGSSQVPSGQRRRGLVSPPQRPKKRSRQLFSGDSNSGLDALATLAASSLSGLELEGLELGESLNVVANAAASFEDKVEDIELKSGKQWTPKRKVSKRETKSQQADVQPGSENGNTGGEAGGKTEKQEAALEDKQPSCSPADSSKRKRTLSGDKFIKVKAPAPEGDTVVMLKPRSKVKRPAGSKPFSSKQGVMKETGAEVGDSVSPGNEASVDGGGDHSVEIDESSLPLKLRNKKKGLPEKLSPEKLLFPASGVPPVYKEPVKREPAFCPHSTPDLRTASAKAKIIHCLCPKVRRWCICEWFYSAIDLPWFARNEFVEYLNHAGLGHVPRLTRVEWGVIRGSLGKPRRLSKRFLQEEREKLEDYRESVRTHYHELRTGVRDGLPADLARPLTVGQKVIARHPKTIEIHDGSILTVDRCRCRVQFDQPELGVELVMDIDAMPIHPLDNMPEVMRRRRVLVDGIDRSLCEDPKFDLKLRTWSGSGGVGSAARAALNERLERRCTLLSQRFLNDLSKRAQADTLDAVREAKEVTNRAVREAKDVTIKTAATTQRVGLHQSHSAVQSQAREADARALADLSRSLDKKEALVVELRQMNHEASSNRDGYKTSEAFQRQYATVVLHLKEVNKQVTNALLQLRQRNKYQDNAVPPWHRLTPQGMCARGSPDAAETTESWPLETAPTLAEMTGLARKHARLMVTTAVKAMDGLKASDDALQKLGSALEAIPKAGSVSVPSKLPAHAAPATFKGGAPQGGSTSGGQPWSLVQSSSSSITEDNTEPDTGTVASSTRMSQPSEIGPTSRLSPLEAAAHDLARQFSDTTCLPNEEKEGTFLTELITSCVATLFMLQTLSDRPFSTADVQQTLDSALMTLRPKSANNHFVFKEIEQQIAIVKAQITARIPVPSSMPFVDMSIAPAHTS